MTAPTFDRRLSSAMSGLRPAERRVAHFFRANREHVLVASAAELAEQVGASDATVVRTARAIGYAGLGDLRRHLAAELRSSLSPASRVIRTLGEVSGPRSAFDVTLDTHARTLADLRRDVSPALFEHAVGLLCAARRVRVFGIGPSSALADYFAVQLTRFGVQAGSMKQTGLLLADELLTLRDKDLLVILAYSRVYPELEVLVERAEKLRIDTILLTDTLGAVLRARIGLVLPVKRGRSDSFSMHTATLALIEALLVGVAAQRPIETIGRLELLNELRRQLSGKAMALPIVPRKSASLSRRPRRGGGRD